MHYIAILGLNDILQNQDWFWKQYGEILLALFQNTTNKFIDTMMSLSDKIGVKEFNTVFSNDYESLDMFHLTRQVIQRLPSGVFAYFPDECNRIIQKFLLMK